MSREKLEYFRSLLLERRKFILESIDRLRKISQVKETKLDFNEKYSDQLADLGSDSIVKILKKTKCV